MRTFNRTFCLFVAVIISAWTFTSALKIISRAEWGARHPLATRPLRTPASHVFIHHSDGPTSSDVKSGSEIVRSIQDCHMDERGWSDIGYHFLIGGDGSIFEGRDWSNIGAHVANHNRKGHGIVFLGNFMEVAPTEAALTAAKDLINYAVKERHLRPNYFLKGHRQMGFTDCPGDRLYKIIRSWPNFRP
ncbi:putative Peptidoglycan-recognition protein SC2 [Hypsibius exemplaris]|uniref:Peptidoglycan-recognition protein n=1 Tax=Hypsibius exemplaris TaxID=2072580 RepID=A0A1W0WNP4_HYPEX|nr:putative Peptidoglycan-recognition protein SC2 [Hypsibius exemplaris]